MKTVVLVACVAGKKNKPAPAKDLYDSDLFHKSMAYANKLTDENDIYILSAKHKLLPISKVIAPYDMTLKDFSSDEKQAWSEDVLNSLKQRYDLNKTKFVFLAGEAYKKYLEPELPHTESPLKGLRIGQQKQRLGKLISEVYQKIKKLVLEEIKKILK
jgi:hypothetical protein